MNQKKTKMPETFENVTDQVAKALDGGTATKKQTRQTDGTRFFTPAQVAARWAWHPESVRRAIRQRRIASVVISRRRLIPLSEIERVEREGFISAGI
jgi:hypothetical protein